MFNRESVDADNKPSFYFEQPRESCNYSKDWRAEGAPSEHQSATGIYQDVLQQLLFLSLFAVSLVSKSFLRYCSVCVCVCVCAFIGRYAPCFPPLSLSTSGVLLCKSSNQITLNSKIIQMRCNNAAAILRRPVESPTSCSRRTHWRVAETLWGWSNRPAPGSRPGSTLCHALCYHCRSLQRHLTAETEDQAPPQFHTLKIENALRLYLANTIDAKDHEILEENNPVNTESVMGKQNRRRLTLKVVRILSWKRFAVWRRSMVTLLTIGQCRQSVDFISSQSQLNFPINNLNISAIFDWLFKKSITKIM